MEEAWSQYERLEVTFWYKLVELPTHERTGLYKKRIESSKEHLKIFGCEAQSGEERFQAEQSQQGATACSGSQLAGLPRNPQLSIPDLRTATQARKLPGVCILELEAAALSISSPKAETLT